jgi:hypothetical protein
MLPTGDREGKPPYPGTKLHYPLNMVMEDGIFGINTHYNDIKFVNFSSNLTFCGMNHSLFVSNIYAADIIPIVNFTGATLKNITRDALGSLMSPLLEWAN